MSTHRKHINILLAYVKEHDKKRSVPKKGTDHNNKNTEKIKKPSLPPPAGVPASGSTVAYLPLSHLLCTR